MTPLFDRITSFENLRAAAQEVLRGKRSRCAANTLFVDLERSLFELQRELTTRSYVPGPYRTFKIRDPKPRMISAAPLRDRVVHTALVRVIEPLFERRFIHHSYACRKGRGTHRCLAQFVRWARSSRFVLALDVRRFFPSIDHQVLKAEVRRGLRDEGALWLVDTIVDASNPQEPVCRWFPGDGLLTPLERRHGLPIGNLTSQFLANVLLDRIDHHVKDRLRVRRYLRYADDMALFADEPGVLYDARAQIQDELADMRLRLHPTKSRLRRIKEGVTFLGFVVGPRTVRLDARAIRRHRGRMKQFTRAYADGHVDWPDVADSLRAWHAHAAQGTTEALARAVFRAHAFTRGPKYPGPASSGGPSRGK